MYKVMFAASEAVPYVKTGGLADVCGSLPMALANAGCDVRLVLPAYHSILHSGMTFTLCARFTLPVLGQEVEILQADKPVAEIPLYLVHIPHLFDRPGSPYQSPEGHAWPDNAERFAGFCRAVVELACQHDYLNWQADIVHCHDWHSGLVPALLDSISQGPTTVFTIHNLGYLGRYDRQTFERLALPAHLWRPDALEFHGDFSFLKSGLIFAEQVTTVSPNYAEEICSPAFGQGLEGLLQNIKYKLKGILNGVDYAIWDPRHDHLTHVHYDEKNLDKKQENKLALQREMQLPCNSDIPLLVMISRLVAEKGSELILSTLPEILNRNVQFILLGSGSYRFEEWAKSLRDQFPQQFALWIGHEERLAHQLQASADMLLMPSHYEPCGLNQIYSMRYGTIPIVHRTGGLADTVINANPETLENRTATGISFDEISPRALLDALDRALNLHSKADVWRQLQENAMQQEFSWAVSAQNYLQTYQQASDSR